jgi:Gpi18-like mannosyltransferase
MSAVVPLLPVRPDGDPDRSQWVRVAVGVAAVLAAAVGVRLALLPYTNRDLQEYLLPWFDFILGHGGLQALGEPFANYTPAYLTLLALVAQLSFLPKIAAIKLISIAGDFVAALLAYRLVRLRYASSLLPACAAAAVLLAPGVVIESALWGQSDVIYTSFLLGFLACIIAQRPVAAMLCFGIAVAVKLQAAMLAPLVLLLLIRRRIPLASLLLLPIAYLVLALPALAAGRPWQQILTIYFVQADTYHLLSMRAPNPYLFIDNALYPVLVPLGLSAAAATAIAFAWLGYRSGARLDRERLVLAATYCLALLPFVLPKMHERSFYPASVFAIVLAFYRPRLTWIAVALQASSALSYLVFLVELSPAVLLLAFALNLAVVIALSIAFIRSLYRIRIEPMGDLESSEMPQPPAAIGLEKVYR